jgi:hypothetical protein
MGVIRVVECHSWVSYRWSTIHGCHTGGGVPFMGVIQVERHVWVLVEHHSWLSCVCLAAKRTCERPLKLLVEADKPVGDWCHHDAILDQHHLMVLDPVQAV